MTEENIEVSITIDGFSVDIGILHLSNRSRTTNYSTFGHI